MMRRKITLLVAATTSAVIIAFLIPLAMLVRTLAEDHAEATVPTMAAETALAKDWLSPEEDAAWASL